RIPIGPSRERTPASARSTDAGSVTSSATPSPPIAAATRAAASPSRSATATRRPCAASSRHTAAPIAPAPPLTSATRGSATAGSLLPELREVGLPPGGERLDSLAGLGRAHEELEPGEGERAEAADRLAVGVEGVLEKAQCGRALLEDLVGPAPHLRAQLGGWHDRGRQCPAQHRLGVVLPAQEPDLARALLAEDAREVRAAEAGVEGADPGAGLPEAGRVGRDREIAHDVQHVAAADRVA